MTQQVSFAQAEYEAKRKTTRCDRFPGEMELVVPWAALAGIGHRQEGARQHLAAAVAPAAKRPVTRA